MSPCLGRGVLHDWWRYNSQCQAPVQHNDSSIALTFSMKERCHPARLGILLGIQRNEELVEEVTAHPLKQPTTLTAALTSITHHHHLHADGNTSFGRFFAMQAQSVRCIVYLLTFILHKENTQYNATFIMHVPSYTLAWTECNKIQSSPAFYPLPIQCLSTKGAKKAPTPKQNIPIFP